MSQEYKMCEISQNNGKNGVPAWMVIKGCVYDVTDFLKEHPGGEDSLLEYAGRDATKAFYNVGHSTEAIQQLKLYKIGVLAKECQSMAVATQNSPNNKKDQQQPAVECCQTEKKRFLFCFYY